MTDPLEMLRRIQREQGQKFLPDARLHEIFESDLDFAKEHVKDGLMMQFTIHGRHRDKDEWQQLVVGMADWPPPGADGKKRLMMSLGVKFHVDYPEYMPMAVSQMSEAWMSMYEKDDPAFDDPDRPMPSKDPKRIECLLVNTISMDQRQDNAMLKILRGPGDKYLDVEPFIENRYEPEGKVQDPRTETNYLILDFYMGYFGSLGGGEK